MREDSLVLVTSRADHNPVPSPFSNTSAESLWDTVKNIELHILLREPALIELARRKEPGILSFCENLVNCGDQECWFTGIKALAELGTYEAVQRLLSVSGSLNPWDRKIVIQTVATVLTSTQREAFRRVVRLFAVPGKLDVTGWTTTALRILRAVCEECGINLVTSSPEIWEFAENEHPRLTSV
ncbi:MAG: hypothetical protein ACXABY_36555 [Candidatus Thorarchaeota archaeon]|jgi:hypothetical protein